MRGLFITFEGTDGVGKTTQAALLAETLQAKKHDVVLTREPGGTPLGQVLRQVLLGEMASQDPLTWEAEVLLLAADRAQHVARVIRPALERGAIVVCDRYLESSLIYQGYAADHSLEKVRDVNEMAVQGVLPDLTFLLALPPEQRHSRDGKPDRIEGRGLAYQQKAYDGFLALAHTTPYMEVLEVTGKTREEVRHGVWCRCLERWPWLDRDVN